MNQEEIHWTNNKFKIKKRFLFVILKLVFFFVEKEVDKQNSLTKYFVAAMAVLGRRKLTKVFIK